MSEGVQSREETEVHHPWQRGGIGAFLRELIDDASLFPPAMLPMAEAMAQHLEHRRGPYHWALARFVCPASRLPELTSTISEEGAPWRLSVILDMAGDVPWPTSLARALEDVSRFRKAGKGIVETLEARLPAGAGVREFASAMAEAAKVAPGARPFVELPFLEGWEVGIPRALEEMSRLEGRVGAKVRCGGGRVQDFPTPHQLARFITWCARLGLPLKATAGLHHPLPHPDPRLGIRQHGFLNVIGGALLAVSGHIDEDELLQLLCDDDPARFRLDTHGFGWRDRTLAPEEIEGGRRLVICFGSCSFLEPLEGLTALLGMP